MNNKINILAASGVLLSNGMDLNLSNGSHIMPESNSMNQTNNIEIKEVKSPWIKKKIINEANSQPLEKFDFTIEHTT